MVKYLCVESGGCGRLVGDRGRSAGMSFSFHCRWSSGGWFKSLLITASSPTHPGSDYFTVFSRQIKRASVFTERFTQTKSLPPPRDEPLVHPETASPFSGAAAAAAVVVVAVPAPSGSVSNEKPLHRGNRVAFPRSHMIIPG